MAQSLFIPSFSFVTLSLGCALSVTACHGGDRDQAPPAETQQGLCPAAETLTGPTLHDSLEGSETWTAEASPHVVRGELTIPEGHVLRIAPCAEVELEGDASIQAVLPDSVLDVAGEAQREVVFHGEDAARWGNIEVSFPASGTIRYAKLSGAGSNDFESNATLLVRGDGVLPTPKPLLLQNVEISDSAGPGVVVERTAAFADGSRELRIKQSGSAALPAPLVVGEHTLNSIPDGDYTGNRSDEIWIRAEGGDGDLGLLEDATLRDLGVPYRTTEGSSLYIGSSETQAKLTIEAGVTVRFAPGTQLGIFGDASATLKILGTAAAPVVLTSAMPTPGRGDWTGVYFYNRLHGETEIAHTRIEYAGGYCSCSLVSCNATEFYDGALILNADPGRAFIHDSQILHSAGHGIVRSWLGSPDSSFVEDNEIDDVMGCQETLPPALDGACPDPLVSCEAQ